LHATFAKPSPAGTRAWIVGGGIVFPLLTLFLLLNYTLAVGSAVAALESGTALQLLLDCFGIDAQKRIPPPSPGTMSVHVIGKQWGGEVRYEMVRGETSTAGLPGRLHVPVGAPGELRPKTKAMVE